MSSITAFSSNYLNLVSEKDPKTPEELEELIQEYNQSKYAKSNSSDATIFICTSCRQNVSEDDSYSDRGQFLHCSVCVQKEARERNMTTVQWLKNNVWMRDIQ